MNIWIIEDRGFLPIKDPCEFLKNKKLTYSKHSYVIENLASNLSNYIEGRKIREALVSEIRRLKNIGKFIAHAEGERLERLMMLFSYFASAYVYAENETPAERLPKEIAIPLTNMAIRLQRPPILSYASYCLYNWRRLDPDKPIELGNIELLQHFNGENNGRKDESWFILVHVDIEAKACKAIEAIRYVRKSESSLKESLQKIRDSLFACNETLNRMPEHCREDVYFRKVRPYIFGFEDIVYEGCFKDKKQTFRGETGAQSSVIPVIQAALGIRHKESMLTLHLRDMRKYMPLEHRQFIKKIEGNKANPIINLRDLAIRMPKVSKDYNDCVNELIRFRKKHLEYATNYIEKKVDNPKGTGGTPYIPWLSKLIKETEEYIIR